MTRQMLTNLFSELSSAVKKKDHPYRYFTMASCGFNGHIRQRTMVLRDVIDANFLVAYTDKRSKKMRHIKEHNEVSLLFFNPETLTQINMIAYVEIERDKDALKKKWDKIPDYSKIDYITSDGPGTIIDHPDDIEYNDHGGNFAMLYFVPEKIEILQIKRPNHVRASFEKTNFGWEGVFITP
ncbi:Pyridoxine/pyridoxamine 5'-phosphate oxidase [Pustulibacterium marinum]|uniref:Pyridoxine/pyridoxamine 5'-phosphate oxidase n=1 Tax=Pustulibacterium marinum TaxID=1224947 RepID=A0A1I7FAD8_9FLAO|nr:pyridoxamine 5'-phosphate oxidase family protein [Pustulibacterium marinum]SFU33111.1 Pyridoxine/pyridoxamine 5'-phosphate oxidase [Pustulibacterium marinum]